MKVKIKIVREENCSEAFEVKNRFLRSDKLTKIYTFAKDKTDDEIMEILREYYFERLKEKMVLVKVAKVDSFYYNVYVDNKFISERDDENDTYQNEDLKTEEDIDKHIRRWFRDDLTIQFPEIEYGDIMKLN